MAPVQYVGSFLAASADLKLFEAVGGSMRCVVSQAVGALLLAFVGLLWAGVPL